MARKVISQAKGPLKANLGSGVARGRVIDDKDIRDIDVPVIPKPYKYTADGRGYLTFDGYTQAVELTGPVVTDGGAPAIRTVEYDGKRPGTAHDPAPLGTASLSVIEHGANAHAVHDVIVQRAKGGFLLRVYGPMIGPYGQGDVWCFSSMPKVEVIPPMNPDGSIRAFRCTIELTEWRGLGEIKPQPGSRVGSDAPRKRIAQQVPDAPITINLGRR